MKPMIDRRVFSLSALAVVIAGEAHALEADEMSIGAPEAPLQLVEYASATCPHCAHFHELNWATLKSAYIDTWRLRLTMREMATPPAPVAFAMFQVARCGGADANEYFRRLAILFAQQRAILGTGTMGGVRDALVGLGGGWGLSADAINASLIDEAGAQRLRRSIEEATQRGVTSTPTFFLNGDRVSDPGFHTPDGMARTLDEALRARQ